MKRIRDLHTGDVYVSIAEAHRRTLVPYDVIRKSAMRESLTEGTRFVFDGVEYGTRADLAPQADKGGGDRGIGVGVGLRDPRHPVMDGAISVNTRMTSQRCRVCPAAAFYFENTTEAERFNRAFDCAVSAHDIRGIPVDEFIALSDSAGSSTGPFFISAEQSLFIGLAAISDLPYLEFSTLMHESMSDEGPSGFIGALDQTVEVMVSQGAAHGAAGGYGPWCSEAWRFLQNFCMACTRGETAVAIAVDLMERIAHIDGLLGGR